MGKAARALRLLPPGALDEEVPGRSRCAICLHTGSELRRVNYAFNPWGQRHRQFPAGSIVHWFHALEPREPLAREIPSTWGRSPAEFLDALQVLRGKLRLELLLERERRGA